MNICILREAHVIFQNIYIFIFKYYIETINRYIYIYAHICMNRCILGEINDKTYILAKSPKVHKGGGSTPPPIGGYWQGDLSFASGPNRYGY